MRINAQIDSYLCCKPASVYFSPDALLFNTICPESASPFIRAYTFGHPFNMVSLTFFYNSGTIKPQEEGLTNWREGVAQTTKIKI